ncbi:1,4-dihydroxy-6-naphthoate synthase [Alteribacillus persepolensis]|uniref:1,4-dihydroxy-6-naphtoate synthase n=1 Tax=Alteribacillus persepolensis TaxID=568899 RepID=A0A1G8INU3_9BACI|nr:1,4-dihydroxy-6-naphthoate synthase [Alteribacillus persepolensis]SDI20543.1 1,4-dihydroxy-6-naphthoate synthase [Alteribacillus persepolensis]
MNIAYSPCPNDTFVFHALVHGLIPNTPSFDVTYADIDKTNYWAANNEGPDIMKISFAALPWVLDDYRLVPCGGALGRGCGPLVLTAENTASPSDIAGKTVAVPSDRSTAYILFRLWTAQQVPGDIGSIRIMPFDEIMPAVQKGEVDAGLVIHEARFTYQTYGLHMLQDLGEWWEKDTGLPIPLGAIIVKRSSNVNVSELANWIRQSVQYAWDHPDVSREYVLQHAQEMSPDVADSHIDLYVNGFTKDLGRDGYGAIESLLGRAAKAGLVPHFDEGALK